MRRFLILTIQLSCIFSFATSTSNPKSKLLIKNYSDGILVYSPSTKMEKYGKSGAFKPMEYDITALSNNDSISFTCSIYSSCPLQSDSLEFDMNGEINKYAIERIFIEPTKKYWCNRIRVYLNQSDMQRLSTLNTPPILKIDNTIFQHSNKVWEREKSNFKTILEIIRLNKTK